LLAGFAGAAFAGVGFAGAAFAAGFGTGFFTGGLVFVFAAVFDGITVLFAARNAADQSAGDARVAPAS